MAVSYGSAYVTSAQHRICLLEHRQDSHRFTSGPSPDLSPFGRRPFLRLPSRLGSAMLPPDLSHPRSPSSVFPQTPLPSHHLLTGGGKCPAPWISPPGQCLRLAQSGWVPRTQRGTPEEWREGQSEFHNAFVQTQDDKLCFLRALPWGPASCRNLSLAATGRKCGGFSPPLPVPRANSQAASDQPPSCSLCPG